MKPTFPSSEKITQDITEDKRTKYPLRTMKVGESFGIDANTVSYNSFVKYLYRVGKKYNKKFKIVDHGNGTYEVGCISSGSEGLKGIF